MTFFMLQFNVSLNNFKEKQGDFIEVIVWGEPGAYVGISAMDNDMYGMHAGNELTHAGVSLDTHDVIFKLLNCYSIFISTFFRLCCVAGINTDG